MTEQKSAALAPVRSQTENDDLLVWCFCAFVLIGSVSQSGAFEKYAIYITPFVGFAVALLWRGQVIRRASRVELLVGTIILAYGYVGGILSGKFNFYTMRETLLISLPFFCAAYIRNIRVRHLKIIGLTLSLAVVIAAMTGHAKEASFSWSHSSSLAETAYSFPLTVILLTLFLSRTSGGYQVVFFGVSLASLKRIAVAGALMAAAFYIYTKVLVAIFRGWGNFISYGTAILIFVTLTLVGLNLSPLVVQANHYVTLYYLSPEELLQGRYFLQTYILNYSHLHSSPMIQLFGHGLGSIPETLAKVQGRDPMEVLVHNDFLKMYFEGGYAFLVGFCVMLVVAYGRNSAQLTLLVYQFCLFLTDNTVVYVFHMVPLLFCLRYVSTENAVELARDGVRGPHQPTWKAEGLAVGI